jgi:cytochrome c-type biogenesis protein CcmH/NrfF
METSGQTLWLILLTLGVVVLAAAIIYGMMRNRQRTRLEEVTTEAATRREYAEEDRDPS